MKSKRVKALVEISLMVALLSVVSQISIPTVFSVPITLQIFAVCLIGYLFGIKKSLLTIFIYIVIGAIGIPVFANFGGGIFHLISYTGGFVWGFIPLVTLCSLKTGRLKIPMGALGVFICHFVGVTQYSLIGKLSFFTALLTVSLPYIIKDILLVILAFFVAKILKKRIQTS